MINGSLIIKEIRKNFKKFLDSNENEDTIYQNLWDAAKSVIRGKFIAMKIHSRK
jgi:hypothetical protein